jgi:hypothetical protein
VTDSVNTKINQHSSPQGQEHYNGHYNHSQSNFSTDTQVIGSKTLFAPKYITPQSLEKYMPTLLSAKAYEHMASLIASGAANSNGPTAIIPIILTNKIIQKGNIVQLDDLKNNAATMITSKTLFDALVKSGTLSPGGEILNIKGTVSGSFESTDFSAVMTSLQNLELNIQNPYLKKALIEELFALLKTSTQVIEVTSQETTEYASHKKNVLEGFLDFTVGNFLKNTFYPAKIKTARSNATWEPVLSVKSFFPQLVPGFLPHAYYGGASGITGFNTHVLSFVDEVNYLKRNDITQASIALAYRMTLRGDDERQYIKGYLNYNELKQTDSPTTKFYTLGTGFGTGGDSVLLHFNLGLTYKDDEKAGLGYTIGGDVSWFAFNPISLDASYTLYQQPNLFKSRINWQLAETSIGASAHLFSFFIKGGYRWLFGTNGNLTDGLYIGVGNHF